MRDGAAMAYRRWLTDHPDDAIAASELQHLVLTALDNADGHRQVGAFDRAARELDWFLEEVPGDPAALALAGEVAYCQARFRHARHLLDLRLQQPQLTPAIVANAGLAALACGDPAAADALFDQALALGAPPDQVAVPHAAAVTMAGDWRRGFQLFEARLAGPGYAHALRVPTPVWNGVLEPGLRLVLIAQQGFGDAIQMVRFVPQLQWAGVRVVIAAPLPLHRVLQALAPVVPLHQVPEHDVHLDLMSLPHRLGTTPDTVPNAPYLAADPDRVAVWQERLRDLPGRRLGLVWAGSSHGGSPVLTAIDRRRSLPANQLRYLPQAGISWVSLQIDRAPPEPFLLDVRAHLPDFAETAAAMMALDAIVAVDTAAIHLAGALGRPATLLNRFDSCWRWGAAGETTPWYPSVRILRQADEGAWRPVLAHIP